MFAERTLRSLKKILYLYMEDYRYKCIQKLAHFITTLIFGIQKKLLDRHDAKNVKDSEFSSILYRKPLRENIKPKYNWRQKSYLDVWLTLQEKVLATVYTKSFRFCWKDFQETSNIHKIGWAGCDCRRYNLSKRFDQSHTTMEWFTTHLGNYFQTKHSARLQAFYRSNWIWRANGRMQFRKKPTHRCTKNLQIRNLCFLIDRTLQLFRV